MRGGGVRSQGSAIPRSSDLLCDIRAARSLSSMTDTSRTALITGANRGLGRATALHLGRAGVDVVVAYRSNAEQAEEVLAEIAGEGGRAVAVQLDTTDFGAFADFAPRLRETLRETFGREQINALVNNAGSGAYAPFAQTSETQPDEMLDVHVKGPYLLTQALLPLLADGGDVLFVSSGLTRFSTPGYSAYASAKGAVEVLARYLAQELGERQIAVNAIAPGATGTDFGGGAMREDQGTRDALGGMIAMGRIGEPEDIAGSIAALLTSESHWITGQRIEASGGMRL